MKKKFLNHFFYPTRVDLQPWEENVNLHLDFYNKLDLTIDTFPYSGTTTTCESLLMGTPVLTLFNDKHVHVQNVSTSILKNSNLENYICYKLEEFVPKIKSDPFNKFEIQKRFLQGYVCNKECFKKDFETIIHHLIKEARK